MIAPLLIIKFSEHSLAEPAEIFTPSPKISS
jgi:hypothetical protein